MVRIATLTFALFLGIYAQAQFNFNTDKFIDNLIGDVRSDRPGNSMSALTCGFVTLQVQSGYRFQRWNDPLFDGSYTNRMFVPTDIKIGLSNNLEINTTFTHESFKAYDATFDNTVSDGSMNSPLLGVRYSFLKGRKWVPTMALQSRVKFRRESMGQNNYGAEFILATLNDFGKLDILMNFGLVYPGFGNGPVFPAIFNVSYNLGKTTIFAEGNYEFQWGEHVVDAGLSVNIGRDFVLDFYGGVIDGFSADHWFAEAGFTYRFSFMKMMAKKKADEFFKK